MTCHVVGLMVPFSRLPDFGALSCGLLDELSKSQFCTFARSQLLIPGPRNPLFTPPTTLRCTFAGRRRGWNPTLKMCLDIQKAKPDNWSHSIFMTLCFSLLCLQAKMRGWRGKGGLETEHE